MSLHTGLSDQELTGLLKSGDRSAFTEIYNRYWKHLFNSAYNASRNKEDSLDICQNIFLWFWENRTRIDVSVNLKGYLFSAVKYKIANQIRDGKYREHLFDDLEHIDARTYQVNELEIAELKAYINLLIQELPERCREAFLLSRDQHLSHKEIAMQLGIGEKAVNAHVTRALKKLRAPLSRLAGIFLLF